MQDFIAQAAGFIWNWPVVGLCLLGCIFFTFRLGFIQITSLKHAIDLIRGKYDNPNEKGQITHFQALSAALSGTIGLGNIAGVAIAIAVGGPGAIFWMWVIGFFGMATKFAECTLATHYREENKQTGEVYGGPMYYIKHGFSSLTMKPMAYFYAVAIALASIGVAALFQSNQAAAALYEYYDISKLYSGIFLFILTLGVIIGGINRIGTVASAIVPFMCFVYIGGAVLICILNSHLIPEAFSIIFSDAFTGNAVAGGSFVAVLMAGVRRAIFSNEAGLGSAAIAHAAVKTNYPIREGIVASLEPFIDTIIVCTATALVIIMSGNFGTNMYVNDGLSYSFEKKDIYHSLPWKTINQQQAPKESSRLQSHIDGKNMKEFTGSSSIANALPVLFNDVPNSTIRFAYFKKQGDFKVEVYQDQQKVATLSSDDKSSHSGFSISNFKHKNEWKSAIINVPKDSKNLLFLFVPSEQHNHIYIDNIEAVKASQGIALTTRSFDKFFEGFGSIFITISVFFFAFSTIITWAYYGETAINFLFGKSYILLFKCIFVLFIIVGATQELNLVVNISDALVGLLVIPNMIALLLLSPKVVKWNKDYFSLLKAGKIKTYK